MPIYEYICSKCGKPNEVLQKFDDPTPEKCDACGARHTLSRMVSRSSFVLRGGGWYSDLYASTKKPASDSQKDATESKDAKEPKEAKEPKDQKGQKHAKEQKHQKESKGESKKSAADSPPASSPVKSAGASPSTPNTSKKSEKAS